MKNLLFIALLIISTSSCGISNQVAMNRGLCSDSMKRVKVDKDECEIQSKDTTTNAIRAYGVGVSVNPLEAREKALLSAKIHIEDHLKQALLQKIKIDNEKRFADFKEKHKFDTDTTYFESLTREVNMVNGEEVVTETYVDNRPPKDKVLNRTDLIKAIEAVSEEIFIEASVICSNSYTVANNYEYHLCLQLTKKDYSNVILSYYDTHNEMHYMYHKFKEAYDAEMKKLNTDKKEK
jgi:hypothetical protein